MRRSRFIVGLGALAGLAAGCATPVKRPVAISLPVSQSVSPTRAWQRIASAADTQKIGSAKAAWTAALAEAKAGGHSADIAGAGDLLKPNAALARPAPTPGSYSCRLYRLGRNGKRGPAFEKFKPFFCYIEVEGDVLTIVKQTGSQRPAGRLWDDVDPRRLIYLGSLALGDEQVPRAYGEDKTRDMAGVFERVAPFHWRLVIPWPRGTSKLDLFELTPVSEQPS